MLFAIVDIETTGSRFPESGILEIGIVISDGINVIDKYESLVNPEAEIPQFIRNLTGITPSMVVNAPKFSDIAAEVYDILKDKVFVAHNVNFDYGFVKGQLANNGFEIDLPRLCTVRYSRKVFPEFKSYSLGNLARHFNIEGFKHHRAAHDALATELILRQLLRKDKGKFLDELIKKRNTEKNLPPMIGAELIEKLPETPGVYYFKDKSGKNLYIGKAVNIKKRIKSHFSGKNGLNKDVQFLNNLHSIDYMETGNELLALIIESSEIRKNWPPYNKAQKRLEIRYSLFDYKDRAGQIKIAIKRIRSSQNHEIISFKSLMAAREFIISQFKELGICGAKAGFGIPGACILDEPCNETCHTLKTKNQNKKIENWIQGIKNERNKSFFIKGKGRKKAEVSLLYVDNGKIAGYNFFSHRTNFNEIDALKNNLIQLPIVLEHEYLVGNYFLNNSKSVEYKILD